MEKVKGFFLGVLVVIVIIGVSHLEFLPVSSSIWLPQKFAQLNGSLSLADSNSEISKLNFDDFRLQYDQGAFLFGTVFIYFYATAETNSPSGADITYLATNKEGKTFLTSRYWRLDYQMPPEIRISCPAVKISLPTK